MQVVAQVDLRLLLVLRAVVVVAAPFILEITELQTPAEVVVAHRIQVHIMVRINQAAQAVPVL
jgi:hypothetical protein